jgi:hypothetical protein
LFRPKFKIQIDIKLLYFLKNCHIINKIMRQNEMRPGNAAAVLSPLFIPRHLNLIRSRVNSPGE